MFKRNWKSHVDQLLENAQNDGHFDNLRGQGQPLKFEDESHIPHELRMAHRLLKEHDLVPDWILLKQDIEKAHAKLRGNVEQGWKLYQDTLVAAGRSSTPFERRQQAETNWRQAQGRYQKAADKLNSDILRYNLKVPPGIPQQALVKVERVVERLAKK
jgi:hypothetical protein